MNTLRQTGSPCEATTRACARRAWICRPAAGIGLAAAQGMAPAEASNHSDARVYAVLGDGELDEGAVWEGGRLGCEVRT